MDITALGINKGKIKQFNNKGIYTIEDLIKFLPRKYYDFRYVTKIKAIKNGEFVSVTGKILEIKSGDNYIKIKVTDDSGKNLFITWFNQKYILKMIKKGEIYNFCGKVDIDEKYYSKNMLNPLYFSSDLSKYRRIIPVYSKITGMSDDYLLKSINTALQLVDKSEYLDIEIIDRFNLYKRKDAINSIHQPEDLDDIEMAKERILFDDLFCFAIQLKTKNNEVIYSTPIKMHKANTIKGFLNSLPFTLTDDQLNVARNIFRDMRKGKRVNALIQGDVGCGKTMVAFILMLIASENGYQSVLMAPTNVLAKQHYEELYKIGEKMGYKVGFLSGTIKGKKKILKEIELGNINMVVGTHAVISENVNFKNLGLTIVDEEHRFGVIQREMINRKNKGIHNITMSATPIPRSLALTIYGENTDIYSIIQMPKGRKKIKTKLIDNSSVAYEFMRNEIKKGRQCYVICPLIEESDSEVMQGVLSVGEIYKQITDYYRGTGIRISAISGDMKEVDIEKEIELFSKGKTNILISTTIIEVGVNIPNATVMVIQNAERFGLAQLHQLRGRVGRGIYQSYCLLISEEKNNEKLKAMVDITDGFEIAKADLKLRGAGDFIGTKQSGENKYVMLMLSNQKLFNEIREEINNIFNDKKRYEFYKKYIDKITYNNTK